MQKLKNKEVFYKYTITLMWPQIARHRSIDTLQERPDIIQEMNHFMQKIETVCKLILKRSYKIDYKHNVTGVRIQFSSGQDLYEFVIRQPEFEWEIVPKIGTINSLNGEFKNLDLVYQPTGFSVV